MNTNTRIELEDSLFAIIAKMCEGNPGVITVCMQLYKNEPTIDPDSMWQGMGSILGLDSLGIYGSNIWVLYKDVCEESILYLCTVLRAQQLGFISEQDLKYAMSKTSKIDLNECLTNVKTRLPRFGTM